MSQEPSKSRPSHIAQMAESDPATIQSLLDASILYSVVDGDLSSLIFVLRDIGNAAMPSPAPVTNSDDIGAVIAALKSRGLRLAVVPLTDEDFAYAKSGVAEISTDSDANEQEN
jgi:hypothetical protein